MGSLAIPCALGHAGIRYAKREGDGATPAGRWSLLELLYRADRMGRPLTRLPLRPIRASDGWCDAAGNRNYNRRIRMPYPASYEELARNDALYDIVVVLSYNLKPRIQGRGSAVFFHLLQNPGTPTAGCVAIAKKDMLKILQFCGPRTAFKIGS